MKQLKVFSSNYINWTFAISVLFIVTMCFVLSCKINYHVDEIFTYGKANYKTPNSVQIRDGAGVVYIPIEDGKIYVPGGKPLMDFVVVQPDNRFNYANVWKNEARAVHPPFHSALVHTVSSFFPGKFSHWYAGVVNIVFAVLTLLALRSLSQCFIHDKRLVDFITFFFAFSGGILSNIAFLRMYIMAMFWVTLLTYYFVRESKEQTGTTKFFICLSFVTLCGALTHYYCILYAVLISVTYGVWLLYGKKYHYTFKFICTMVSSGILSYMLFPAMLKHIFSGPRGIEVMRNAVSISDFFIRLKAFYRIINSELFGNLAVVLLWGLLILCFFIADKYCYAGLKGKGTVSNLIHGVSHSFSIDFLLLIVPTVIYFIVVAKITVYKSERYMVPIYANIFLLACLLLVFLFERFPLSKFCKAGLLCITLAMITIKSWFTVSWQFLYLDSKSYLEKIEKYAEVDNICLYNGVWRTCVMLKETQAYRSIQFCGLKNYTVKQEILERINKSNPEKLMVSLVGIDSRKHVEYLEEVLKQSGSLNYYQKLGTIHYGFVTTYLLSNKTRS